MAENHTIPFSSLKNKPLETRIYALTMLYQSAERLQALGGQMKDTENNKINDAVISFATAAMGKGASAEAEAVVEQFPELMDLVLTENIDEQRKMAQEFLQKHQEMAFVSGDDVKMVSEGNAANVSMTKTLEEINAIVLDTTQNRKSAYTTEDLAHSVATGNFDGNQEKLSTVSSKLQQLKKNIVSRLVADWMVYKASDSHKLDALAGVIERIAGRIDVTYQNKFPKTEGNTPAEKNKNLTPKQKANKRVRAYFSESSAAQYNKDFPDNAVKVKPASKEQFLKLMGIFLHSGQNQYLSSMTSNLTDYTKLKIEVARVYPDNTEEALNRILNVKNPEKLSEKELEQTRQANFAEKSRELYIKSLCAAMDRKKRTSKHGFDVASFVQKSFKSYIQEMQEEGANNVLHISTIDENATSWKEVSAMKKEQFESMTATVHHHRPIASTIDFYLIVHPEELQKGENLKTLSDERLSGLADKAQQFANNIGNHCLVFGSEVHDKLEADGFYSVTNNKESTVLACRYDSNEIIDMLQHARLDKKLVEQLSQDVAKYSKVKDKDGIIRGTIDFPDHPEVETLRQQMSKENSVNIEKEIPNLLIQYAKSGPVKN
ncbi:MAG: hypothetical protein J6Y91_00350 [Alphaproteobacteria bacterium]|nr:hypothetical protein [Alphaproteobacteria bacterium]